MKIKEEAQAAKEYRKEWKEKLNFTLLFQNVTHLETILVVKKKKSLTKSFGKAERNRRCSAP